MKKLKALYVTKLNGLARPLEKERLGVQSPAMLFFADYLEVSPTVVDASLPATSAQQLMSKAHLNMLLLNNSKNEFVGVVSSDDVIERKIMQKVSQGTPRNLVLLSDVMTPMRNIVALSLTDVVTSTIGEVIQFLMANNQHFCMVVDEEKRIRGVFCSVDIAKRLNQKVHIPNNLEFYKAFA